jgi:hypothetical protein
MLVYARDFPFHEFESFSCQSRNLNFAEEFGMQNIFFKRTGFLNIDVYLYVPILEGRKIVSREQWIPL